MFRENVIRSLVAAALFGAGATALAIDEVEPNHPIQSAQRVTVGAGGTITINGVIGINSGAPQLDVDFFSFYGKNGDVVLFNIDGGIGGARSVDTWIGVFGPGPAFILKGWNDDRPSAIPRASDPGSSSVLDSYLKMTLDATGIWTVGVSALPRKLATGGVYTSTALTGTLTNGDYTLHISGLTPPVQQIHIDVKPGSTGLAPVNPKAKGVIPVALLGSADFDPFKIDVKSLRFGATGTEDSLRRCAGEGQDVNGDGIMDRVCHFENQEANFADDDDRGILKGKTADGTMFEGSNMLKVVPVKKE